MLCFVPNVAAKQPTLILSVLTKAEHGFVTKKESLWTGDDTLSVIVVIDDRVADLGLRDYEILLKIVHEVRCEP